MKVIARSLVVMFVALIAVPALAVTVTITTAVQLLAAVTGLYMGGTQHPLSTPPDDPGFITDYMKLADKNYIVPGTGVTPTSHVAVIYPAEFFPVFGSTTFDDSVDVGRDNLNSCLRGGACNGGADIPQPSGTTFVVFGYSQSAVVASLVKQDLIEDPAGAPAGTKFVLDANPMRGNGGILARGFKDLTIPLIGITFYGATPTDSCDGIGGCLATVDTAEQYDLLGGDAPARLDPLAFANSIAAYALLHGNVPNRTIDGTDPQVISQGEYGDTDYYMITAPRLPILMIAERAGIPGPVLALPDAILRVWIEDKYRRDLSPGEQVPFQLIPIGNPISLIGNTLAAIPVGIDDTIQQAGGPRVLGTADVYRPFGVGGQAYSKVDGTPVPDESAPFDAVNTAPFNVLNAAPLKSGPAALKAPAGDEVQIESAKQPELNNEKQPELNNEKVDADSAPEVTKPRPFQLLRGPIEFDPPKRPSAVRPDGEGPLKRIVNALTGQRPDPAGETGQGEDPEPAQGVKSEDDAA